MRIRSGALSWEHVTECRPLIDRDFAALFSPHIVDSDLTFGPEVDVSDVLESENEICERALIQGLGCEEFTYSPPFVDVALYAHEEERRHVTRYGDA